MSMISRITLSQGASLGDLWRQLRQVLKGRYIEIWSDVFEDGFFWVADEARIALEEVKIPFKVVGQIPTDRVKVYYARHLQAALESLPNEDSVKARVLAGHGIGAVLFFIGDGQTMPPEEPTDPKDALFYLSKPGAKYYYLWRLFRSKEDAEGYVVQKFKDDENARSWAASIPVVAYGELLQNAEKEGQA
ncbi:MAG: hypothetical protein HYY12_00140 [Candidatus Methylomirabilis oxyfera]|nr:hypothetical protein [Candidatus Methylomirabilis oxyfera]